MRHRLALAALTATILSSSVATAQTKTWTTTADFNTGTLASVSDVAIANEIVLGPTPVSQTQVVWSDNFNYGLILKLNAVTGAQLARYDSTLTVVNGVSVGVRPPNEFCNWSNTGNCPEGIAVDTNGDAWVSNDAFGNQGSLTRIAASLAECVDRNMNGMIDTSSDLNRDGIIDMNPAHGEYLGQKDECLLTTVAVGAKNAWARDVAVDEYGKVWVASYNEGKVYRYNPASYALELTVMVGGNPFQLATGGSYLFVSNAGGQTARVQVVTGAVDYAPCPGNYGIAADPGGQVAWLGSWMNQATGMYRADFSAAVHTCTLVSSGPGATTGMTLDTEPGGPYVWGANYTQEKVSKWTTTGAYVASYAAGATANAHGLSVDFAGNIWVVNDTGTCPGAFCQKQVAQLNAATGVVILNAFIGYLAADQATYPENCSTGYCDGATPFVYGDFTGVQANRQAPYAHAGSWSGVYDGGVPGIPWSKVSWNAEAQGAVPAQTTLQVAVRAADTPAALAAATYAPATSGATLTGIVGRYVQVQASVAGPGFVTPVLSDITVTGPCAMVGSACCIQSSDCAATNACETETCPTPGGACQSTPVAGCCNTAADCTGGTACTTSTCSGTGGTCSYPVVAGCCLTNADCTGGSVCVSDTCPTPGQQCVTKTLANCCTANADCTDTNPCTVDTCDVATGVCSSTPTPGCCTATSQCSSGESCVDAGCVMVSMDAGSHEGDAGSDGGPGHDSGPSRDSGSDAARDSGPVASRDSGSGAARDSGPGAARDRGVDAGTASSSGHASTPTAAAGCGCAVPGTPRRGDLAGLAGMVGLVLVGARRRRRGSARD
jgi:MYXO-CTERM domain-containing protein